MKILTIPTLLALAACSLLAAAAERPNIVWIVSEDNSIHYLNHFFPGGAEAPAIEALAKEGTTFDHAFSNAPVCSVARTAMITGCHGPRIGTQFHRRNQPAPMPEGLRMFPAYLREAGYHTTNNHKKDYNAIEDPGVWDESSKDASWRDRPDPKQPFFHFRTLVESHEGTLHFNEQSFRDSAPGHDPADVALAPQHPDTPLFRHTHARYLDHIRRIDRGVGEIVAMLEKDGLLESTIIFYFGDHGGVLPGSKGFAYNPGLHVPLVVRIPETFRHLAADFVPGGRVPGFVSFVDFGPTVLNLAGVEVPGQVDGRPFLGEGVTLAELNERDEALGYADRMDEKYDFVRALRKGKYHYVRAFQPWLPDGLMNQYRYLNLAMREWQDLHAKGELKGPQAAFFEPRTVEMLYDCETDPYNTRNLAADPSHRSVLLEMRGLLGAKLRSLPDLSFYPESHLVRAALGNPVTFGRNKQDEIAALADIADLALRPFAEAEPKLRAALASNNPWERYWAAMAATAFGHEAAGLALAVKPLLQAHQPAVRLRAVEFLGSIGEIEPQPALAELVNASGDAVFATEALNSVVWFHDGFAGTHRADAGALKPKAKNDGVQRRMRYLVGARD